MELFAANPEFTVKFEPQAGNKFSYETVFTDIHFPYPRIKELLGKGPISTVLKVEIPNVGTSAFCQQIMDLYL